MNRVRVLLSVVLFLALSPEARADVAGRFHVLWGDSPSGVATVRTFFTEDVSGKTMAISGGAIGKLDQLALDGRAALVRFSERRDEIDEVQFLDQAEETLAFGSQSWITLLCAFSDVEEEPRELGFFEEMLHRPQGGIDAYWREASYGLVDLEGTAVVDWLALPEPQGHYVPIPNGCALGSSVQFGELFEDCTAAADSLVDFDQVDGVVIMTNAELDGCAWGGSWQATLDGTNRRWPAIWAGPTAYAHQALIVHEWGHALGLSHSNNSDGDSNPYDSPWDVMSSATGGGISDPVHGRLPVHPIGENKAQLGWLEAVEITEDGEVALTLSHLSSTPQLLRVPADDDGRYYSIEVRGPQLDSFDSELPGDSPVVLIHHVDPLRLEPAWLIDAETPPATFSMNEGVVWRPGEVFESPPSLFNHTVRIAVDDVVGDTVAIRVSFTRNHCPGFDDEIDGDGDGVPDGCDVCSDFDDTIDEDLDGIADGCDACSGENSAGDSDQDGVCSDLDCDDSSAGASVIDICGVCGGDSSSCALVFENGFESGDYSAW